MSVNHYSRDVQHTLWWQHHQNNAAMDAAPPPENTVAWLHHQNDALHHDPSDHHRESLFEKSLTPSDVGKLNRLVIPKQHAEKYFPLSGGSSSSSSSSAAAAVGGGDAAVEADKGMLLSFEDESGKCWRFRYSYWNSSQSYVLTKGWSRYVKEKQLDAGDVVFFQRHPAEAGRLFIGWRRRGEASAAASTGGHEAFINTSSYSNSMAPYRQLHPVHGSSFANPPHQSEYSHQGATAAAEAQTPAAAVGSSRTVRLFGVNLECQLDDHGPEPSTSGCSSHGSAGPNHFYSYPPRVPPPDGMNIYFSGDTMKQMRNWRG